MKNLYIHKAEEKNISASLAESDLELLCKNKEFEIMYQTITRKSIAYVYPADDPDTVEFFYCLKGSFVLAMGDEEQHLGAGDSFYVSGLKDDVLLKPLEDSELLYAVNRPMFDMLYGASKDLYSLAAAVDEENIDTVNHSRNTMAVTIKLYEELKLGSDYISLDDIVIASRLHDVGKKFIPAEILAKKGRLTHEEYEEVKKHAAYSANMLSPKYPERICNVVKYHHERMDGSGYPDGLSGDEIPLESRIIAVADSFDAMVSQRSYNRLKSPLEAAIEIVEMSDKYDPRVAHALLNLVNRGELDTMPASDDEPHLKKKHR